MRSRTHSGIAGLLVAGLAAIVPASAGAATVSENPGILTYSAAPGEANHVSIERWGLALRVTESGTKAGKPIRLAPASGCWKLSADSVGCSGEVSTLVANLGDGDDFFDASGTGVVASLICGAGHDTGITTPLDSVATDCESRLPEAAVPAPATPATPAIPAQTVEVSPSGIADVQVTCPAESGGCSGTVAIQLAASRAGAAPARRAPTTIGRSSFTAKSGTKPVVPVRLSKRGRQRIVRGRNRRGRIRVTTRTARGTTLVTAQNVTFSAGPRAKLGRGQQ